MNPFTTYMIAILVAGIVNAFAIKETNVYDISFIHGEMLSGAGYFTLRCNYSLDMDSAAKYIEKNNDFKNVVIMEMVKHHSEYSWSFKGEK